MNKSEKNPIQPVADLLKEISAPARIKILLAIGREEVCVCHLEANLGMRQAYLSQHLMALRQAGILLTTRDGRFIHYRLANPQILDVIQAVAHALDLALEPGLPDLSGTKCPCPKCQPDQKMPAPTG